MACCSNGAFAVRQGDSTITYIDCPSGQGCLFFASGGGEAFCDPDDTKNPCDPHNSKLLVCAPYSEGGVGGHR